MGATQPASVPYAPLTQEALSAFHAIQLETQDDEDGYGEALPPPPPPQHFRFPLAGCRDPATFYRRLYQHFYHKGLAAVVVAHLLRTAHALFTFGLAMLLVFGVKWRKLAACCASGTPATNVEQFVHWEPTQLGSCLLAGFICWRAVEAARTAIAIRDACLMMHYYAHTLRITNRELHAMQWEEVVVRVRACWPVGTHGSVPTAFLIAASIQREEDLLVALLGSGMFRFMPSWLLTHTTMWCIRVIVIKGVGGSATDAQARRRLYAAAAAAALALPLLFPSAVALCAFQYAEDVQTRRAYLGSRQWSPAGLASMREFAELPHVFERRVAGAYQHMAAYLRQFSSPLLTMCARTASYMLALLLAVLVGLAAVKEPATIGLTLAGRNLVWYAVVFTTALALTRAWVPEPQDAVQDAEGCMLTLLAYTHTLPPVTVTAPRDLDARDAILAMCPPRLLLLLRELLSVLISPLLLLHWARNTRFLRGALARSQAFAGLTEAALAASPPSLQGKVHKSALSLLLNHPRTHGLPAWTSGLLERLTLYARDPLPAGLAASVSCESALTPTPTPHLLSQELHFYWLHRWLRDSGGGGGGGR